MTEFITTTAWGTLELNEKIKDLQRVKEVAAVFNSILLDIKDKEGLSRALNRWTKLYRGSLPMYVDKREDDVIDILYNEVLTGLNKALQRIPERSSQFNVICTDKRELFDRLETDFDKLYTGVDNKDELKRIMRSQTQEYLTDASLLYSMYVTDGAADTSSLRLNDYSPIAINYYRALEFLVNQMFYIPYRKRVLEVNSNINNRSYAMLEEKMNTREADIFYISIIDQIKDLEQQVKDNQELVKAVGNQDSLQKVREVTSEEVKRVISETLQEACYGVDSAEIKAAYEKAYKLAASA